MAETSPPPKITLAFRTDVGQSRSQNQDFGFVGEIPGADGWTLLVVADGLGGHAHGEWASERAVQVLLASIPESLAEQEPAQALERAFTAANRVVFNEGRDQGWRGSATTLSVVLIRGQQAWWANVGDSRIYGRFSGRFEQLSMDHSVVAEQVRAGLLPASAAATHPHRNVVTRTVGFEPFVEADIAGPLTLAPGDLFLVSSDGLHGVVDHDVLEQIVHDFPPEEAAKHLVDLANAEGGPDNITVAIGLVE